MRGQVVPAHGADRRAPSFEFRWETGSWWRDGRGLGRGFGGRRTHGRHPRPRISPGKDQEYFADGVAEEILNALARVEGLHVAG
ncbi:MAG TPA: hypothetical protein VFI16_07450, partial [Anaeromyxobacteraceae bacterium]|nr:hypothetical protein [Anaeromyxobacteraceae bacterium]